MPERGGEPSSIAKAIQSFLTSSRIGARVVQAGALTSWPTVVGEQIASVTEVRGLAADGTLLVEVKSHAWMTELSLREPEILEAIRLLLPALEVKRIRWLHRR